MLIMQAGDRLSYWSGEQTEREVRGQPSALITSQSLPQTPQVKKNQTEQSKEKENFVSFKKFILFIF